MSVKVRQKDFLGSEGHVTFTVLGIGHTVLMSSYSSICATMGREVRELLGKNDYRTFAEVLLFTDRVCPPPKP